MKNDRDLFDRLTQESGGRFPLERAPAQVRAEYEEVAKRANDLIGAASQHLKNLPPIHFDFIWNSSINAVAFQADGRYFVGLHTGMLYMLRFVIGRMLSNSRWFPRIGNAAAESALEPLGDYFPDAEEMVCPTALLTPKDPIRRSFAWFLQD